MKILFLTAYSELAASSRTRVYQYLPHLDKKGINSRVICFAPRWLNDLTYNHQGLAKKLKYYILLGIIRALNIFMALVMTAIWRPDIVFVQKITFPFYLEKVLKMINKNIIFDFDDAIWIGSGWKYRTAFRMMYAARCCIVENEYNKKIALDFCPWVEIIIGPIDTDRYFPKKKPEDFPIVIGWSGSRSTIKYLYFLERVLAKIMEDCWVVLKVSSSDLDFKMSDKVNWEIQKWDPNREVEFMQSLDIGIMPLPDNEWTRGKGGYKLLEYLACGVPVVASPVGVNKEIVTNSNGGWLATTEGEWQAALFSLIRSKNLRTIQGRQGRAGMEKYYSLKVAADILETIFNKVAYEPIKDDHWLYRGPYG